MFCYYSHDSELSDEVKSDNMLKKCGAQFRGLLHQLTCLLHHVVRVMNGYCAGMLKLELCDHVATISSLNFAPSPSVLLVSASMDGTLKLWDMSDDGNMIKTLRTNCTAFYGCRWAPDATALATVGNYHSVSNCHISLSAQSPLNDVLVYVQALLQH